ncbi:unnamed protein product [Hymenolepis diminuta]|uniref:Uncharacterized protein n=1 Tax=Hymenolepis diminuta TaxID=6216 RepID=A0A564YFQ9_HYMDI|nr:unnamed protein product [Hymenolepis diminuta]
MSSRPTLFPTPFLYPLIYNPVPIFFFAMMLSVKISSRFMMALSRSFKEAKRLSLSFKMAKNLLFL